MYGEIAMKLISHHVLVLITSGVRMYFIIFNSHFILAINLKYCEIDHTQYILKYVYTQCISVYMLINHAETYIVLTLFVDKITLLQKDCCRHMSSRQFYPRHLQRFQHIVLMFRKLRFLPIQATSL